MLPGEEGVSFLVVHGDDLRDYRIIIGLIHTVWNDAFSPVPPSRIVWVEYNVGVQSAACVENIFEAFSH